MQAILLLHGIEQGIRSTRLRLVSFCMMSRLETHSSSEKAEFCGWTMRMYRKTLVVSTHDGNCRLREYKDVIACRGLGAVVDTANITEISGSALIKH